MTRYKSFLRQVFNTWGLWALLTFAVFAFALTIVRIDGLAASRLADEGADAQATVTGLHMTATRSNNRTRHHLEVSFTFTANGTRHDARQSVSQAFYTTLTTGNVVPVRYWTRDPSLAEIEPGFRANQSMIGQIVAAVALILTLIFAALGWRWAAQARWMVRNGVKRAATVTRLVGSALNVGKTSTYRAEWQDDTGTTGRSRLSRSKHLPGVGTKVTILTDPSGRRPSLWEGDL